MSYSMLFPYFQIFDNNIADDSSPLEYSTAQEILTGYYTETHVE
ncbi:uncharacterized protein RAG0_10232 [Rhynchosporium agropyri]|uniref:Uncharacterized protein n=3 Tax=Rhynchosporium TaxID=38037 RepID=A0A1E1MRE8_RHYSE|nr:uncharacterized protein RAG0_10232 [Rhynchosporium agropyri]CZT07519.1 uncharacterized protein RCO7_14926 [Rhynchosporium commune]CZT51671.1 uncharacterized protein RSE6_12849 [Rhynchosporium secalis]